MRYGYERDTLSIEDLNEPSEIGERPSEPVDLVDDDGIDPTGPDIGEQALQRRPPSS
jgi:hypothetical protein